MQITEKQIKKIYAMLAFTKAGNDFIKLCETQGELQLNEDWMRDNLDVGTASDLIQTLDAGHADIFYNQLVHLNIPKKYAADLRNP